MRALEKPGMHLPEEGDQAFLNRFYEYRHFGLPHIYNLNLVLYEWFPVVWEFLWPKAKIIHFTVRKPSPPAHWCIVNCPEKKLLEWYSDVFREMLEEYGLAPFLIILTIDGWTRSTFMDRILVQTDLLLSSKQWARLLYILVLVLA
jgi:hypothetical protein